MSQAPGVREEVSRPGLDRLSRAAVPDAPEPRTPDTGAGRSLGGWATSLIADRHLPGTLPDHAHARRRAGRVGRSRRVVGENCALTAFLGTTVDM